MNQVKIHYINNSPLLQCCDDEERSLLVKSGASIRPTKKGSYIYKPGDSADDVFLLLHGAVKLTGKSCALNKSIIYFIPLKDDLFGYDPLLGQDIRTLTARALTDSTLLGIPGNVFKQLMKNPDFSEKVLILYNKHLTASQKAFRDMMFKPVMNRLAASLLNLELKDGSGAVLQVNRKDIASLIGSSRETVSKQLKSFEEDQLIKTNGKTIHIINYESLNVLACMYE